MTFTHTPPPGFKGGAYRPTPLFGGGLKVPKAGQGYTGTIPIYNQFSIVQMINPVWPEGALGEEPAVVYSVGVNQFLVLAGSGFNDFRAATSHLWWQYLTVNADQSITLGASGLQALPYPLDTVGAITAAKDGTWAAVPPNTFGGPGITAATNPFSVAFGTFNSGFSSLSFTSGSYASVPSPSPVTNSPLVALNKNLAIIFTCPIAAAGFPPAYGLPAVISMNPSTGAVIDYQAITPAAPVTPTNQNYLEGVVVDSSHVLVFHGQTGTSGSSPTTTNTYLDLIPFDSSGHFGTKSSIGFGFSGFLPSDFNLVYPEYYVNGGYVAYESPAGPTGFGVPATTYQVWQGTTTPALPTILNPYPSVFSNPYYAGSSVPPGTDLWVPGGATPPSGYQAMQRVQPVFAGGAWSVPSVEVVSFPDQAQDTTGAAFTSFAITGRLSQVSTLTQGAVDPNGLPLFLMQGVFAVPSEVYTPTYAAVWAGEVRTVQTGTRTRAITFAENEYNSSYNFGSYPGCIWYESSFYQISYSSADMSGGVWHGNFIDCDMSYANFTNGRYGLDIGPEALMTSCSAAHADFSGSNFIGELLYCDFTGTKFHNCVFEDVVFYGCGFIGADFTGATFRRCSFGNSYPDGIIFWDESTIWPAGFNPATIPYSRSTYWDFSNQTLTGTDLSKYNLCQANFQNSILQDVPLSGDVGTVCFADFTNAQILGATLGNALFTSGPLRGSATYNNYAFCKFGGATIDYGPGDSGRVSGPGSSPMGSPMFTHADFTNARFVWSGAAAFPGQHWCAWSTVNISYAIFDYCTAPPGCVMHFQECNGAWASFVGAQLGPTDGFAPNSAATHFPGSARNEATGGALFTDSVFCYADFSGARGGWFVSCNLSNAKFVDFIGPFTSFAEAYIGYADFSGAAIDPTAFAGTMAFYDMIPALYNSHTKATPGLLAAAHPAVTGQDDPSYLAVDGHQDFSNQVIQPSSSNQPVLPTSGPYLNTFGADFNGATLQGVGYDNLSAYNSNFQGVKIDPGFIFNTIPSSGGHAYAYQSHWGAPPAGASRGPATGLAGPQAARQPGVQLVHLQSSSAQSSSS
jgi:uncharacterized protein YjbI with pentapeptide repeats